MKFDSPEYIYRRTFYLPVFSNDFDAAFFPEGGPLSPVLLQNIAFKILGADGLSREAAGYVLNARGDTPDSTSPEDVVIEGVDRNGKVCRYVTTINQYTE